MAEKQVAVVLKWTLGYKGGLYGPSVNKGTAEEPDWTKVKVPEGLARTIQSEEERNRSKRRSQRSNRNVEDSPDSDNTGGKNGDDDGASKENRSEKQSEKQSGEQRSSKK